jgi:hypothetical protein
LLGLSLCLPHKYEYIKSKLQLLGLEYHGADDRFFIKILDKITKDHRHGNAKTAFLDFESKRITLPDTDAKDLKLFEAILNAYLSVDNQKHPSKEQCKKSIENKKKFGGKHLGLSLYNEYYHDPDTLLVSYRKNSLPKEFRPLLQKIFGLKNLDNLYKHELTCYNPENFENLDNRADQCLNELMGKYKIYKKAFGDKRVQRQYAYGIDNLGNIFERVS